MTSLSEPREITQPDPADDLRHRLEDRALERESAVYIISLPEHGLATTVYTWVTRDHVAGALFVVCGPGVEGGPIIEAVDGVEVGPEANFDDWHVGPVRIAQAGDLRTATIAGHNARASLSARFTATHPAYAYSADPRGCPPFAATDRIEQSGRIQGSVTVDGREFALDTTGARDHSWGTRDWDHAQHWKWVHAQTREVAVHLWQIFAAGQVELRGYVARDGRALEIAAADVRFAFGEGARQRTISASITDTAGGQVELTGEYFAFFELPPVPSFVLVEGGMAVEIDGVAGTGWSEFAWPSEYLGHLRESPLLDMGA